MRCGDPTTVPFLDLSHRVYGRVGLRIWGSYDTLSLFAYMILSLRMRRWSIVQASERIYEQYFHSLDMRTKERRWTYLPEKGQGGEGYRVGLRTETEGKVGTSLFRLNA